MVSGEAKGQVVAGSLRGTVHERLLRMIEQVSASQKIVLLDMGTVKIVDAAVSMPEILDEGVFLIENVSIGRQPYPSMAAIYIVRADDETLSAIIKDFTPPAKKLASGRTGPMYAEAHLFFTTAIDSYLMERLAQSPAASLIKSFQEIYIDFIPIESRAFHLGGNAALFGQVFQAMIPNGPEPPSMGVAFDGMAAKIASACVTMGEVPRLRYRIGGGDCRSQKLAIRVQQQLEDLKTRLELRPSGGKPATLLIVDRTVDLVAPIIREFTLQALANDLLSIGDGTRYEYTFSTMAGPQTKTVSLDERDNLWMSLRHAHIADCSQLIIERFNSFLTENKAAVKSRKGAGGPPEDVTNLSELKETMAALGEFQELKSEYARHLSLAQECLSASDKKKQIEIASVEQNMVTGLDPSGEPVRDQWNQLAPFLTRPELDSIDKARLLLLYLLTQPRLGEAERRALFDHAKLEQAELEAVRRLVALAEGRNYKQRQPNRVKGSKRKSVLDESPQYDVSRFVPAIKIILEDLANEELDSGEFPYVKPDAGDSGTTSGGGGERMAPISLRVRSTMTPSKEAPTSAAGGPIFLFILGGMTFSEMRSVYELADRMKREFYIGSDQILTPKSFLEALRSIQH